MKALPKIDLKTRRKTLKSLKEMKKKKKWILSHPFYSLLNDAYFFYSRIKSILLKVEWAQLYSLYYYLVYYFIIFKSIESLYF